MLGSKGLRFIMNKSDKQSVPNANKRQKTNGKKIAEGKGPAGKKYFFGGLKKISLDSLEVFGTISSSISEKEINSLELIA